MDDLICVALTLAFFAVTWLVVEAFDRLSRSKS
jgi:hypothetical protein